MKELLIGWVPVNTGTVVVGDPGNVVEVEWEEAVARNEGALGTSAVEFNGAFIAPVLGGSRPAIWATVNDEGQVYELRITLTEGEL